MKKFFALLFACFALTQAHSQAPTNPKLTALTKPNPAQAIHLAGCTITDIGDDQLLIDFEIDGIGFWSFYLISTDSIYPNACLVDWTRSTGHPTECAIIVRASTYIGCFWSLENVHDLPPFFPPYKTH